MERLRADAGLIAGHFGLRYEAMLIERPTARSHYGICYQDGTIKIRLNHAVTTRPLRYSSLVNTVCHELAHLKHFDHGEGFKRFYGEILEWARARRIYRPRGRQPEQAALIVPPLTEAGRERRLQGRVDLSREDTG
jgi:predicted metal-dependent hydrolase